MSEFLRALMRPLLPPDVRQRLKHQRLEAESANRHSYLFTTPGISVTLVKAVDAASADAEPRRLIPARPSGDRSRATSSRPNSYDETPIGQWYASGGLHWSGGSLSVTGPRGQGIWYPARGGLRPGFEVAEIFQAGQRPVGTGECHFGVAALAAVGLAGRHLQRIIILDPEARSLGWIPTLGLAENDLIELTKAAGISYRSYGITLARFTSLQVSPAGLCEALFVRSAVRVKLVSKEIETQENWFASRTY